MNDRRYSNIPFPVSSEQMRSSLERQIAYLDRLRSLPAGHPDIIRFWNPVRPVPVPGEERMTDDLPDFKLYRCTRCGARPVLDSHACTCFGDPPKEQDAPELVELEAVEAAKYLDPLGMKA
jgi:hypothetical protein